MSSHLCSQVELKGETFFTVTPSLHGTAFFLTSLEKQIANMEKKSSYGCISVNQTHNSTLLCSKVFTRPLCGGGFNPHSVVRQDAQVWIKVHYLSIEETSFVAIE